MNFTKNFITKPNFLYSEFDGMCFVYNWYNLNEIKF